MNQEREWFADSLRRLRTERGFSQNDLAKEIGCHRTEISFLERSKRSPKLETLIALARGLDITLAELLEGIE